MAVLVLQCCGKLFCIISLNAFLVFAAMRVLFYTTLANSSAKEITRKCQQVSRHWVISLFVWNRTEVNFLDGSVFKNRIKTEFRFSAHP